MSFVTTEDYKKGEAIALRVLKNVWANDDNTITVPVDSVVVAKRMDYLVEKARFRYGDIAAVTRKDEDTQPKIIISRVLEHEARYVTAYELGRGVENSGQTSYGFVDKYDVFAFYSGTSFAEGFADGLLMPASTVRTKFADGDSIRKIARSFDVSKWTLENRLVKLGLNR